MSERKHLKGGNDMLQEGETACGFCHTVIYVGTKSVTMKKPFEVGDKAEHYNHYHNRHHEDCWSKVNRTGARIPAIVGVPARAV